MTHRVQALRELTHKVRHERPARDLERLHRQKKLTVRERIDLLLDPGTPFLELSTLAANTAYGGEVPGAGCDRRASASCRGAKSSSMPTTPASRAAPGIR